MENVICSCIKCKADLGCFRNSWNQIGNTYFSPVHPPASALDGFVATNSIYKGSEHTQIENSYLQDVVCKACSTVLGLRCDSAPEGHLLKRDQLILRLAEMSVISERTGKKATASVLEKFPLMLPGATKPPRSGRASTVQPSYRAGTPNPANHRHAASSVLPPPVDDRQLRELESFKDWAKSAIQTQQNDIVRISGAVDRMERDLKSFKTFMEGIRTELVTQRQLQDSLKDEELGVIKQDLHAIQTELNSNRQFRNSLKEEEFPILQQDMDALRSEVAHAQHFQQELKDQDIKALQHDVHGLRHSLEGFAYLMKDSPKVSQEKFETLVHDVREVDRKSNEIYNLRTELGEFKAQLKSMETIVGHAMSSQQAEAHVWKRVPDQATEVMSQDESGPQDTNNSRRPRRNSVERAHLSPYVGGEGRDPSVPKRRHLDMENNIDKTHGPPTKRPMYATGKPFTALSSGNGASKSLSVRFRSKDSPVILSSNHGTPSPILDRHSFQNVRDGDEVINRSMNGPMDFKDLDNLVYKSPPTGKPLSTGDIITSKAQLPSGTPNVTLKGTIGNSTGLNHTDTDSRRRHHTSARLNQTHKSGEKLHKAVKAVSSKDNKKPRNFRQRSDTPDQLSTLSADEAMQKSIQKRKSGSTSVRNSKVFGSTAIAPIDSDSPLPSIEGDARERASKMSVAIPTIPLPPPNQNPHVDRERPFPCEACGKGYKFAANLERHKVISIRCRGDGPDKQIGNAQQTMKKRKLGERERLAAELLERQ